MTPPVDYKAAGVDIEAADNAKERLRALVESTFTEGTRGRFGGFGGMFRMPTDVPSPVLVASADGVGTKIKVAIDAHRHDTIGHDLVNHCVNDILVQGARPLFFLDYVAFGRLEPDVAEAIVRGVAAGCRENGCALLGGETAEMPGVYVPPDYDLAGFIVGYVDEGRILGADRVREEDVVLALASTGLHTNGYSLARLIVAQRLMLKSTDLFPGTQSTVGDVLLAVHRSYLRPLSPVLDVIHAMAHITGGGLPGNVNRALPDTYDAVIDTSTWDVPNQFQVLQHAGDVSRDEMFRTFNMGIGMVVITDARSADAVITSARAMGVDAWIAGRVARGNGNVILE
ncbi:MAG TPA: phosphoribosylformylglycinamidine cyclo-ligase [Gemmatimonadaceae bacterium]|nr:phosphoribosylformylglycinamidine cyclo-ligase [Gemmatimonadaceae bacterium]